MPDARLEEGETLEFKRAWNRGALEALAAFANLRGGRVLLGVEDDGTVAGFAASDQDLQKIINEIVTVLNLRPGVVWTQLEGHRVLEIQVSPAPVLVSCQGRYLVRVGTTNRDMTAEQLSQRALELSGQSWDGLPAGDDTDIDPEAVRAYARRAQPRLPELRDTDPPERTLENLGLKRGGRPTRAAILMFGLDPKRHFASSQVHVGRFAPERILDDRMIGGTLLEQFRATLERLRAYMNVELVVSPELDQAVAELGGYLDPSIPKIAALMERREVWDYPLAAIREAVVNALVHRDYTDPGDIQIRAYDDRLEIWNPGRLPGGLTPADLRLEGHLSRPRNPLVAQAFYFAGLVERWGSGTTRMIAACLAQGLPEPEFLEEKRGFRVVFRKDAVTRETLEAMGLNERQVRAVLRLKEVGEIGNAEYQALTAAAKRTASRDLENLVARGLLERRGQGRGTAYRLRRNGPETGQTGQ